MKRNLLAIIMFSTLLGLVFSGKGDGESTGTGLLKLYLINTPVSYDSVVVVVKEVSVHSESQGWIVVDDTIRTFDLLQLTIGARSVLGETSLEAGRYTQIRLLLVAGSYVVVSGTRHPITIPSGFETGIELVHQFEIEADFLYELYLDFDANGNACICRCCRQFKPDLHVYMNFETVGSNAQRRLKPTKGLDRCRCGDRWDHRKQSALRCRRCASNNWSVSAIG